ncbi:uncharacterized protein LOC131635456 [Vicia villosa]|uniref:uncharacterized protein LOC131635456 n=1 Tax=Vicia villosa TaxID=3911 RepID=UPI00273C8F85|nr:uncharacterized protein LOC131635456 [Vicia villosa]
MNHEGNAQVKDTKALALIQKYEAFKMEENESIETMFSRFQTLTVGLRVLNKVYTKVDHVKKIIISSPRRWAPMVTALKVSKDLKSVSLEELISALRSHEIEIDEHEPQKTGKSVALKSTKNYETNAFQVREESSEDSTSQEEDELSLLSRRINRMWKHRQKNFRNYKRSEDKAESSRHKKSNKRSVICYEYKEPGHYKNDCPKLLKDRSKKKFEKKKGLMATWDYSDSFEDESRSEDEHANLACMATTTDYSDTESESEEVFSELTRSGLVESLSKLLKNYSQLKIKYKKIEKSLVYEIKELKVEKYDLKENNIKLKEDLHKAQKISVSETASSSKNILKEHDFIFQKFISKSIDRSKMASMIYGVSGNNRRGIVYETPEGKETYQPKPADKMNITYKPLHK